MPRGSGDVRVRGFLANDRDAVGAEAIDDPAWIAIEAGAAIHDDLDLPIGAEGVPQVLVQLVLSFGDQDDPSMGPWVRGRARIRRARVSAG
jgi:hypothetical protein